MEIKNSTVINKKIFVDFQRFFTSTVKSVPAFDYIFLCVMTAAAVIFVILSVTKNASSYLLLAFMIAAMFATLVLMKTLFPAINYKKSVLKEKRIDYIFRDVDFNITIKDKELNGTQDIKYASLYRVYEGKNAFYIFIRKNQAFLVAKDGFDDADGAEKFRKAAVSAMEKGKFIKIR